MPDPGTVQLLVDGNAWDYWSSIKIVDSVDGISQVSFTSVFDPENRAFRDAFRPFSYVDVEVLLGGSRRFVGTIMDVRPSYSSGSAQVEVEAYATCGVLGDATPPPEKFPTEFRGLKLSQIAEELCKPLGVNVNFGFPGDTVLDLDTGVLDLDAPRAGAVDPGATFDKVALKPGTKVLDLLIKLAKQRALIIRSDVDGNLLFDVASENTGDVVAQLIEDQRPVVSVAPNFSVQDYYSSLTGIAKAKRGRAGSRYTVSNKRADFDVIRPYVYELSDTDPADVPQAVDARMGRMLANSISYDIELATIYDQSSFAFEPNRYVTLKAPKAMVYSETPLLIRQTELTITPNQETAALNCVLPGTLSGKQPEKMPWDEPGLF